MIQIVVNGLVNGAILALMAISVTIIFSILQVPNFGLGGSFVWGAFTAYFVVTHFGLNLAAATLIAGAAMALLGVLTEKLAFKRLRGASIDSMFVAAIGVLIALENAALLVWGSDARSISIEGLEFGVKIPGFLYLPAMRVVIFAVVSAAFVALYFFIKKTRMGKAMRAVSQNSDAARLLGVPIDRVASWTFALGSGMAGVGGALVGAAFAFYFEMGSLLILNAFVVVVLGGLGSVLGAIVGGFSLGIIESFSLTYVTSEYKYLVSFGILYLVLVIRPSGLFGQRKLRADV